MNLNEYMVVSNEIFGKIFKKPNTRCPYMVTFDLWYSDPSSKEKEKLAPRDHFGNFNSNIEYDNLDNIASKLYKLFQQGHFGSDEWDFGNTGGPERIYDLKEEIKYSMEDSYSRDNPLKVMCYDRDVSNLYIWYKSVKDLTNIAKSVKKGERYILGYTFISNLPNNYKTELDKIKLKELSINDFKWHKSWSKSITDKVDKEIYKMLPSYNDYVKEVNKLIDPISHSLKIEKNPEYKS